MTGDVFRHFPHHDSGIWRRQMAPSHRVSFQTAFWKARVVSYVDCKNGGEKKEDRRWEDQP